MMHGVRLAALTWFVRRLRIGEIRPWWMGQAWMDWRRDEAIAIMVPFHRLAAAIRAAWIRSQGMGHNDVDARLTDVAARQYAAGVKSGERYWKRLYQDARFEGYQAGVRVQRRIRQSRQQFDVFEIYAAGHFQGRINAIKECARDD